MESVHPPAGSQVSRVPAQRTPPGQFGPEPAVPPSAPRRHRFRLVLAIVAGAAVLLCLGGVAVGYVLYDRATGPDRSAPDVVVDGYLRAFLADRNDVKASLYTCDKGARLADLAALRSDLQDREKRFGTTFTTIWGALHVERHDDTADVTVTITISTMVDTVAQAERQAWRFGTRREDDWRVCSGQRAD